jgi:hypothetical protein
MKQVHAIRVQGSLFGHSVERLIGGVLKCVDGESENQAKDSADPELRVAVKVAKAIEGEEQKNKWRPQRRRDKCMDAIPERIAEDSAQKARDICGHVEVASRLLGN